MSLAIIPAYAAILGLMYAALAVRALLLRRRHGIGVGTNGRDGEARDLTRALRAHGNFIEYVPLCLLLLMFYELRGASHLSLHFLALVLIGGRIVHAVGISREPEPIKLRVIGMAMTLTVLVGVSVRLLLGYLG